VCQAAKIAGALKGAVDTVLAEHPIAVTAQGVLISNYDKIEEVTEEVVAVVKNSQTLLEFAAQKVGGGGASLVNQAQEAILKNGYYEVNGFKFTEKYYNKLWGHGGRPAPSLAAKNILENATNIIPDPLGYEGFLMKVG
jgi:hypothetical protein